MENLNSIYLPLEVHDFRVLLLRGIKYGLVLCELKQANLDTTLSYTALSYTWGDPGDLGTILFHDRRVKIQRNLAEALAQLLELGLTVVWTDALCINQIDISERNSQVGMMRSIFEKRVKSWCGWKPSPIGLLLYHRRFSSTSARLGC